MTSRLPINLDTIYSSLKEIFHNNFKIVLECITSINIVKDNNIIQTIGIDNYGTLYINEQFWDDHIITIDDLNVVMLHELLHKATEDTSILNSLDKEDPELMIKKNAYNIAMDARINAFIIRFCLNHAKRWFGDFYRNKELKESLNELLKSNSSDLIPTTRMKNIYNCLYSRDKDDLYGINDLYTEVLDYLRKNTPETITLVIGDHGQIEQSNNENQAKIPQKILDGIKKAVKEYVEEHKEELESTSRKAGKSSGLSEQILRDAAGIDSKLNIDCFKRLAFNSLMANVRLEMLETVPIRSKSLYIPNCISRSDLFLIMNDIIPVFWNRVEETYIKSRKKIPIYLDVSGSMWDELPEIIKLITNIRDDIDYVWGFSNEVHIHTLEDLSQNKIVSTGGTDFDCIVSHSKENDYKSIVVITDGEASFNGNDNDVEHLSEVITVLVSQYRTKSNYFCKKYPETVMDIEEVTTI